MGEMLWVIYAVGRRYLSRHGRCRDSPTRAQKQTERSHGIKEQNTAFKRKRSIWKIGWTWHLPA
jgi:hypothetical protein